MEDRLTHVDESGAARMVDVSGKDVTAREAVAAGRVLVSPEVVALLRGAGVPKGDTLAVARLAGIMGAKQTPTLIPLCHPLALSSVTVDLEVADDAVEITATVRTTDRTGVEMEALTAVAVAGLTVIDMVKAVDKRAVITDVRILSKSGGKSGDFRQMTMRAAVVVASNRAAAGVYDDTTGPLLVDFLVVTGVLVRPADRRTRRRARRRRHLGRGRRRCARRPHDRWHRPHPDRPHTRGDPRRCSTARCPASPRRSARTASRKGVPTAALSRGLAGVAGDCLVVNLPGLARRREGRDRGPRAAPRARRRAGRGERPLSTEPA